jgi:hypothetical protein
MYAFLALSVLSTVGTGAVWAQSDADTDESSTTETLYTGSEGTDPTSDTDIYCGDYVSRTAWAWTTNSSCDDNKEGTTKDGNIKALFDGNTASHWHSRYGDGQVALPNYVKIDLGASTDIYGFAYYPRTDGAANGKITSWRFYYSDNDFSSSDIATILADTEQTSTAYTGIKGTFSYVTSSTLLESERIQYGFFTSDAATEASDNATTTTSNVAHTARYVLFVADASLGSSTANTNAFASGAEFYLLKDTRAYARQQLKDELAYWSNAEYVGTYDGTQSQNYSTALEDATSASATAEEIVTRTAALNADRSEDKLIQVKDNAIYEIISAYAGYTSDEALRSTSSSSFGHAALTSSPTTDLSFYWRIYHYNGYYLIQSLKEGTHPNNYGVNGGAMGTIENSPLTSQGPYHLNALSVPGQYNLAINIGTSMSAYGTNQIRAINGDAYSLAAWKLRPVSADAVAQACGAAVTSGFDDNITADNRAGFVNYLTFSPLLSEVQDLYSNNSKSFGTGYGMYSLADGKTGDEAKAEVQSWITAYNAVTSANNVADFPDYAASYQGITLNLPADGTFIRVRSANTNQPYMSSGTNASNRVLFQADADNTNTVFYYKNNKLLNYATGYYIGLSSNHTIYYGVWGGSAYTFSHPAYTGAAPGEVNITFAGSSGQTRYLYCKVETASSFTDAGSSAGTEAGYRFTLEDVDALGVTLTDVGCATFYSPMAVQLPEGLRAYTGTVTQEGDENVLTLTQVNDVIPAETGVVLFGEAGDYSLSLHPTTTATTTDAGSLVGTVPSATFSSGNYTLQSIDDIPGFYLYAPSDSETLVMKGFHSYLPASAIPAEASEDAATRGLILSFGDRTTTGVDSALAPAATTPSTIYDLSGRRVAKAAHGLYLVNGHKVFVK